MMIEDKSTYAYQLRHLANPSFDKIRNLAKDFNMKLPEQLKDELYEEIERGEKQLETEPELMYYLHAFGKMHKAKLNYAFEHLPETFFEIPEINIIDYGCGQAVATICYADFLRKRGYEQKIRRVTLIEPSEAALKRAALHVSVFFPDAEIVTINKGFDDLETKDIVCDEDVPTLHLLSNVLDLECFSLITFKKLVKKRIEPSNLFVCVGPYFGDKDRGKRLDSFAKYFKGEEIFSEDLDAYELDANNSWTCMVRCFGVGDLDYSILDENLLTEVTDEDIENGIEDEFGVVYSKDRKRLLIIKEYGLKVYNIKNGTKVICDYAFAFDNESFCYIPSLQSIYIPETVTSIGKSAFYGCEFLQSIVIPNSVTNIGKGAFRGCLKLTRIIVEPYNEIYDSRSSCNAIIEKKTNMLVAGCSATIIPNSVKSIGDLAFNCCESLQSIAIPNSVTNIGKEAFSECKSLQSIVIPNSVTCIGEEAFSGCKSLQSIVIPESVTSIGDSAFCDCTSLQSIVIPKSVTSIGKKAFSVCTSLQSIVIPKSVTSIGDSAFSFCTALQSIVIPNSVTSIGEKAFYDCTALQSIVIPNSVTSIGDEAFRSCDSLQSIVIPNSVTSIGNHAFSHCASLQSIVIPESVTSIEELAFYRCTSLQSMVIPDSVITIGNGAFSHCTSLQSIVIPNSVTGIGKMSFKDCDSLRAIIIPKGSRKKFEKLLPNDIDKLVER